MRHRTFGQAMTPTGYQIPEQTINQIAFHVKYPDLYILVPKSVHDLYQNPVLHINRDPNSPLNIIRILIRLFAFREIWDPIIKTGAGAPY